MISEQRNHHFLARQIVVMIALSLIPGLAYVVFGWLYAYVIPALVWYGLLMVVSLYGWNLYKEYNQNIMKPSEMDRWYGKLKWFIYLLFILWTLIFILYAGQTKSHLNYIAIFTQLGTSVVASAFLVSDKKLFVPILLITMLPLTAYFLLLDTWYGYVLSSFSIIFLGILLYASYNTNKLIEQNDFQAKHDMLTGLYNRYYFLEYMQDLISRLKYSRKTAYLLMIDLDHFKVINDRLGHDVGDKVLKEVAHRIAQFSEETHMVARLGGDEFVLVSVEHKESVYPIEDAHAAAQALLEIVKQPYHIDQHRLYLSASIGIKKIKHSHKESHEFIKKADIAMYEAKSEGRDGVIVFSDSLAKRVSRHHEIEQKLYFAIQEKKIKLYYQPLFNRKKRMIGCEVLIRWRDDETGEFISPELCISIAEKTGLIVELGDYILEESMKTLQEMDNKGVRLEHFAINISVRQLLNSTFVERVEDLVNQYLDESLRKKLYFEITETIMAEDTKRIIAHMESLKKLGIAFSLDDFGTGFSSLSSLRDIPIDQLKIDRSFIVDLLENEKDQSIVPAILSIAKLFHLSVVAEGVETKEQFAFLAQKGCDLFQGYYFTPAVPKNRFIAYYTS